MSWQEELHKKYKDKIVENELMSKHTPMGVGGVAEFYMDVSSIDELVDVISFCKRRKIPYKIIGNGTNLIFSDIGYLGLVVHNGAKNLTINQSTGEAIAESGVQLSTLITSLAAKGLGGLETLYGIPCTIGGAVVNNAGAHGENIGKYLKSASLMINGEKIVSYKNNWFRFEYRSSRLKKKENSIALLTAKFQFSQRKKEKIFKLMNEASTWRRKEQPIGQKSSGSIFKNPDSTDKETEGIRERSAGFLLERSGIKRLRVGGVQVSRTHANWIINVGNATASDVRKLAQMMREAVEEKFKITLQEEIEYVGDWTANE
ncbi:UDP-N-acetylenolpyruvoylglucosamine reductase [Candidatus Berkelbacteria bacterium CG10_big_fil_rev_8_21_14_0_10_41_12]|uniref:UDP-N-acetylenolpyruvoylglucosamine reductase n=1 Tax=Candidatus Berkelbacteria bacterium CG10_big_fil_rev_8_21_14_0_10_41_12 TaxID=1974513 RepID=A0A2M6WWS6_9BACT|nr:MAG: UDP-N-acetylenolpyruvoylglucosamine reductase [Candidatus Berkelbacteria bacterium CG10_big_fil_rev_8_21_14_0_10_41_12]